MALVTAGDLDIKVTFDLDNNVFIVKDNTDYVGIAAQPDEVDVVYSLTGPTGALGGSTITVRDSGAPVTDTDNLVSIVLIDGVPVQGLYTLSYQVTIEDPTDSPGGPYSVNQSLSHNYTHNSANAEVEMTANCIAPLLTSTDNTQYVVNQITPTITRTHTLYYPPVLGLPEQVTTTADIATPQFYTETHSSKVESVLEYDYGNGWCVLETLSATTELDVTCDATICDLYCCLNNLYKRMVEAEATNRVLYGTLKDKFNQAMSIRNLIKDALECGKEGDVNAYVSKVLALGDCEPGCGCADGDPVPVVGLSPLATGNTTDITSNSSNLVVINNSIAGQDIFNLDFSSDFTNLINSVDETTIVSLDPELIVTGPSVGANPWEKTWTLDLDIAAIQGGFVDTNTQADRISLKIEIDLDPGNVPSITILDKVKWGTLLDETTIAITNVNGVNYTTWSTLNNAFLIDNFLVNAPGTDTFKVQAEIANVVIPQEIGSPRPWVIQVVEQDNEGFFIRFVDEFGANVTGLALENCCNKIVFYLNITV